MNRVPASVLDAFFPDADYAQPTPLGNGLINASFRLRNTYGDWVLQRLNTQVFPQPEWIMQNLAQLQAHLAHLPEPPALKFPAFRKTRDQQWLAVDDEQRPWRAMQFFNHTESREMLTSADAAANIGTALAQFHQQFSTLPCDTLHDTLPGFHNTPTYLQHYDQIPKQSATSETIQFCQQSIEHYRPHVDVLERAYQQGSLQHRVTHGDPKLNNFLFQSDTHTVVALIDLDTVKPGLIHYDIADCIRSCCQTAQHELDLTLAEPLLSHYLNHARAMLTPQDYNFLYPAIELIPFELGLRFFTDYLTGNHYFKTDYPDHNLDRAVAQFKLQQNIQTKRQQIEDIIAARQIRP